MFRTINIFLLACIALMLPILIAAESEQMVQINPGLSSGDPQSPTDLFAIENEASNYSPAVQQAEMLRKTRQAVYGYPYVGGYGVYGGYGYNPYYSRYYGSGYYPYGYNLGYSRSPLGSIFFGF